MYSISVITSVIKHRVYTNDEIVGSNYIPYTFNSALGCIITCTCGDSMNVLLIDTFWHRVFIKGNMLIDVVMITRLAIYHQCKITTLMSSEYHA